MALGLAGLSLSFLLLGPAPFLEAAFPSLGTVVAQWVLKTSAMLTFGMYAAVECTPSPDRLLQQLFSGLDAHVNRTFHVVFTLSAPLPGISCALAIIPTYPDLHKGVQLSDPGGMVWHAVSADFWSL